MSYENKSKVLSFGFAGDVYDFAKSEYEKSRNNLNGTNGSNVVDSLTISYDSENHRFTLNGTKNSAGTVPLAGLFNIPIASGKEYTVSIVNVEGSVSPSDIKHELRFHPASGEYEYPFVYCSSLNEGASQKVTGQTNGTLTSMFVYLPGSATYNNYSFEVRIDTEGETIHEKDIRPIVLWENPTPNATFPSDNLSLINSNCTRGVLYCKRTTGDNGLVPITIMKGQVGLISLAHTDSSSGAFNYERRIAWESDTSLVVNECYEGYASTERVNNDCLIPLIFYGYKY